MTHSQVTIQITPTSRPSTPSWMGEVAAFAQVLTQTGILKAVQEQVHFARARFGQYDLIDFVVVLIGYAVSSEPTLKAFYERLMPFAEPFMALFGRHLLPHRSTLSRFLAVLDQASVETLRTLFDEHQWPSLCALLYTWERFVKDDRTVRRPCRTVGIPRNDAHFAVPQRAIELLGAIPLTGVEHEQRSPPVTGGLFNGLHERSPNSSPALTGEHKEFLHFGSVPRIRFRGQSQLD
jgi:hypothetical protein